jgi:hypothetical protein
VRACRELDRPDSTRLYDGPDPLGFILALTRHRRHLNERQRAMIAAALANMRQGERTDLEPFLQIEKVSREQAAKLLNVSVALVSQAVKVRHEAAPTLVEAVTQGRMKVGTVYRLLEDAESTSQADVDTRLGWSGTRLRPGERSSRHLGRLATEMPGSETLA